MLQVKPDGINIFRRYAVKLLLSCCYFFKFCLYYYPKASRDIISIGRKRKLSIPFVGSSGKVLGPNEEAGYLLTFPLW